MATPEIAAIGLKETRKAFKDFGADNSWRGPFRESYGAAAAVAEGEAQSLAGQSRPTLGGSVATMGSRARGSIRGKGTTTAATLTAGKGVPHFAGWNFGSSGRFRQFPAKTKPDYNLYKAVENKREEIQDVFLDKIGEALDTAFPDG
jgi:hypothetical protein